MGKKTTTRYTLVKSRARKTRGTRGVAGWGERGGRGKGGKEGGVVGGNIVGEKPVEVTLM